MREDIKRFLPLSPAALHILLALASEGFAWLRDHAGSGATIRRAIQTGPGTLYDNLGKLMTQHCVEEVQRQAADDDPRRVIIG